MVDCADHERLAEAKVELDVSQSSGFRFDTLRSTLKCLNNNNNEVQTWNCLFAGPVNR